MADTDDLKLDELHETVFAILKYLGKSDTRPSETQIAKAIESSRGANKRHYDTVFNEIVESTTIVMKNIIRTQIDIRYVRIEIDKVNKTSLSEFEEKISEIPFISEIYRIVGKWDFLIKVNARNQSQQLDVMNAIRGLSLVVNSEVVCVVEEVMGTKFHEIDGFEEKGQVTNFLK